MKQMSQLCRKGHIALVYLLSFCNWIVHDGAERKLERGMPASGLNTSHQHSLQGSRGLFKQPLFKTSAVVSSPWSFPFLKFSFWWRRHRMQVQIGGKKPYYSRLYRLGPHRAAVLGEQKGGRAEDAETRPSQRAQWLRLAGAATGCQRCCPLCTAGFPFCSNQGAWEGRG